MTRLSSLRPNWKKPLVELASLILLMLAAKGAVAEPFYVPSGSMEPTLLIGDALVASKYPYGYSMASVPLAVPVPTTRRILGHLPERGDVVVFRWPGDTSQVWVKRVIGLPGDRVEMRDDDLLDNMPEIVVPPGRLFVLGDNRDNSADSRVPLWSGGVGLLPVENLIGRADVIAGSWDVGMRNQPIISWPAGLRISRFFTAIR